MRLSGVYGEGGRSAVHRESKEMVKMPVEICQNALTMRYTCDSI